MRTQQDNDDGNFALARWFPAHLVLGLDRAGHTLTTTSDSRASSQPLLLWDKGKSKQELMQDKHQNARLFRILVHRREQMNSHHRNTDDDQYCCSGLPCLINRIHSIVSKCCASSVSRLTRKPFRSAHRPIPQNRCA